VAGRTPRERLNIFYEQSQEVFAEYRAFVDEMRLKVITISATLLRISASGVVLYKSIVCIEGLEQA